MSLPPRIGELLERADDEARVHAAWEGTRARLASRRTSRPGAAMAVGAGATLAIAAAVLLFINRPAASPPAASLPPPHPPTASAPATPPSGPLTLADGRAPVAAEAIARPRLLELSDGSRIELALGARVSPRGNDGARFDLDLDRGRARFEVTPGGPRAWSVACGDVSVHVVGTAFVVEREGAWVRVDVEHGRVRVEGVRVPAGEASLGAGEWLEIAAPPASEPAVEEPVAAPPSRSSAWRGMAERGEHGDAYAALEREGGVEARATRATPRELMLLADVARLSGHPRDAVAPLERMLEQHARDAEAPLAAITLGRIELTQLSRPARAAHAFERALSLGVPAAFDAEVCAGLALAHARAGAHGQAASSSRACLARHAEPPHAAELRALALLGEGAPIP